MYLQYSCKNMILGMVSFYLLFFRSLKIKLHLGNLMLIKLIRRITTSISSEAISNYKKNIWKTESCIKEEIKEKTKFKMRYKQ